MSLSTDFTYSARNVSYILAALNFAAKAHAAQRRKHTGEPYINHTIRVASGLPSHPLGTAASISAALLHDTIEDTDTTEADLNFVFGGAITDLVVELTNPSKQFPEWARGKRKKMDRDHLARVSDTAKVIKLLDNIDNLGDLIECSPSKEFLLLYAGEIELLNKCIGHVDKGLSEEVLGLVEKARAT